MATSGGKGTFSAEQWRFYGAGPYRGSRSDLVVGEYTPSAATTGITSPAESLTPHIGNFTTGYDGQVVTGLRITGNVRLKHAGVEFHNCLIEGLTAPTTPISYGSVLGYGTYYVAGDARTFTDCTITGVPTVYSQNGFQGGNVEFLRCDIYGMTDGAGFMLGDCSMTACWVHDLPHYETDPWHTDGTHNDAIQVHGGSNYSIVGCRFDVGSKGTSALLIKSVSGGGGAITNLEVDRSWFFQTHDPVADGTAIAINLIDDGTAMTGISFTDNVFDVPTRWRINDGDDDATRVALVSAATRAVATWTGNVDTTGVPVTMGLG